MKFPFAACLVSAAFAIASLAGPADAAQKRKPVKQPKPPYAAVQNDPYTVYDYDGRVAGRDPDPNIRAAIRRDPRPWEGID
jgi:hypothetical protein